MKTHLQSAISDIKQWVTVAHHIPGRLRLKFDANAIGYVGQMKMNMQRIKHSLDTFPALKQYRLNLAARSVIVEYDNHLLPPALIDALFDDNKDTFQRALAELETRAIRINHRHHRIRQ